MKKFFYFLFLGILISTTLFVSSCNKDNNPKAIVEQDAIQKSVTLDDVLESIRQSDPNAVITPILESRSDLDSSPPLSPCVPTSLPGSTCSASHIITTMYLPADPPRPACSDMNVEFDIILCLLSDGTWTITYSNFEAFYGSCPAFNMWYSDLTLQEKADEQEKWENELFIITELSYAQLIAGWIEDFNCPTIFLVSSYIKKVCYSRCLIAYSGYPWYSVSKSYCGEQCCIRTRKACKNISGFAHFLGPVIYETKGSACGTIPTVCKPNAVPLTPFCGIQCGEEV